MSLEKDLFAYGPTYSDPVTELLAIFFVVEFTIEDKVNILHG